MRFDSGNDMDVDGATTRPCTNCSLRVGTAYVTAQGRCELCDQDFCHTCLRRHAAMCRHTPLEGTYSSASKAAAPDDSTADSSDDSSSDSDDSISVE